MAKQAKRHMDLNVQGTATVTTSVVDKDTSAVVVGPANTYTFSDGVFVPVQNLGALLRANNLSSGAYYVMVSLGNDSLPVQEYWHSNHAFVLFIISHADTYNSAPFEVISVNSWYHHRVGNKHEFAVDSAANFGDYGDQQLYIRVVGTNTIQTCTVRLRQLMSF